MGCLAGHPRGGLLLASVVSGFAAAADTAWSGPAAVAASTAVNMLLFLVGFRVLTVRNVSLRSLLPGAVVAASPAAAVRLGGWYVARQLGRASATYGTFALVIGLLSWLYLASVVTLLAAELNVVRTSAAGPAARPCCSSAGPTSGPSRAWPGREERCLTSGSRSASAGDVPPRRRGRRRGSGGGGGAAGRAGPPAQRR